MALEFYVYIYLDPRKPGEYTYGDYKFDYEPFYVGKGKNNRWKPSEHLYPKNGYLNNKIKKIGANNTIVCCLNQRFTEEIGFHYECKLISLIGRQDLNTGPLINLTDGGEGITNCSESSKEKLRRYRLGKKHTEEEKKKISKASRGENNGFYHKEHTQATKLKISQANSGRKPWNYNITGYKNKPCSEERKIKVRESVKKYRATHTQICSDETRKKMSLARKKRIITQETKEKLRKASTGRKVSEEARNKIGEANRGKKRTEEMKEKMRKPHKKIEKIQP